MHSVPGDVESPVKYYAKAQSTGTVDMNRIAEEISYATCLTDGDVINALRALIRQCKQHLREGRVVKLENFGTLQIQLSSEGADTAKALTSAHIRSLSIQFRPGSLLADVLVKSGNTFRKVSGLKESVKTEGDVEPGTDPEPDGGETDPDTGGSGEAPDPAA